MISGFNADKIPQLYLTDPAGTYSAWKVTLLYCAYYRATLT